MSDERITTEIMQEVENLNQTIRKYCPEITSSKFRESDLGPGDDMNELIADRMKVFSEYSASKPASTEI
ncbi:MAG: hypothetical protein JKX84_05755 [Flavobacteriales bacterium]|nr:hypothetical protein [Flavobacteriales bacterium]